MKNIVEVKRLNDNRNRIYEIPADVQIDSGRLVDVDFGGPNSTALAIVRTPSRVVTEEEEAMLRDYMHIRGNLLKVRRIYGGSVDVEWPVEVANTSEEGVEALDNSQTLMCAMAAPEMTAPPADEVAEIGS